MRPVSTDTNNLISLRDTACSVHEFFQTQDTATDTSALLSFEHRAIGSDIPNELLSRTVATDTRTLVSTRENFSNTAGTTTVGTFDVQTQSNPIFQHEVASNTNISGQGRETSVQVGFRII